MTVCKVTQVDLGSSTIYVQSEQGGVTAVVVGEGIPVYSQKKVAVSELKIADRVYISGTPTSIIATSVYGQEPGAEEKLRDAVRSGMPNPQTQPNPPADQVQPAPVVGLVGDVVSLSPLTIELANKKKTQIVTGEDTKVTRLEAARLEDLKPQSDIVAFGPAEGGTVKATFVYQGDTQSVFRALRDFMGQRFRGGMGARGGPGPGGPGGPPGGPGGG